MKWLTEPVVRVILARLVPVIVGAILGLLGDAGLLDGQVVEAIQRVLSGS